MTLCSPGIPSFFAAMRELRITILEYVKVISNEGDGNCANYSLVHGARLRSSASSQRNYDARMLERVTVLSTWYGWVPGGCQWALESGRSMLYEDQGQADTPLRESSVSSR